FAVAALSGGRPRATALARSGAAVAVAAGIGFLLVQPLWVRGAGPPGWGASPVRDAAHGVDVLTVFGLFFFLCIAAVLVGARARLAGVLSSRAARSGIVVAIGLAFAFLAFAAVNVFLPLAIALCLVVAIVRRDPDDRLAAALAATAFFLVLFPQRIYIYDRMNAFFKLYVEAWIVFAIAVAAMVFRPRGADGSAPWPVGLRIGTLAVVLLSIFTAVTDAQGAGDRTSSPSAQERPPARPRRVVAARGPTLDGVRGVEGKQPRGDPAPGRLRPAHPRAPGALPSPA